MNFEDLSHQRILSKEYGTLELKLVSKNGNFTVFELYNVESQKVDLGNEIDYLVLFSDITSIIYQTAENRTKPFVIVSEMDGKSLYLIEFPKKAQEKYYDSFGYILSEQKKLDEVPRFNFISDCRLESSSDIYFEKNTKRLLKSMEGDNKASWESIIAEKKSFIKTELFIYSLQKLNSWSFQAINNQDDSLESINYVYGKKPKPRGADLKR